MEKAGINKNIIESGMTRPNEIMNVVADITKIKNELSWYPKISFENGIEKCINSFKRM